MVRTQTSAPTYQPSALVTRISYPSAVLHRFSAHADPASVTAKDGHSIVPSDDPSSFDAASSGEPPAAVPPALETPPVLDRPAAPETPPAPEAPPVLLDELVRQIPSTHSSPIPWSIQSAVVVHSAQCVSLSGSAGSVSPHA